MRLLSFLLFWMFLTPVLMAQYPVKEYAASRLDGPSPLIDGRLDEAVWAEVGWNDEFTQFEPVEGVPPSCKTSFKIVFDDENLYVAIRNHDPEPSQIEERMTRRDGFEGDYCGIHLDSYFDRRTAFVFVVNAAGVKTDGIMTDDGDQFDLSLDPVWFVKTSRIIDGWQAEIRIPLNQLRFARAEDMTWGLQLVRSIFRKNEFILWQPISRKDAGWISKYGTLTGLTNIRSRKQLEVAPFGVSKLRMYEEEAGNPYADGLDASLEAGVDAKLALTNDLIMDVAINPDFGQVEADPSEVNLTAFESYFQEKRPFFIEGTSITHYQMTPGDSPFSSDNLFYSRRIGRVPQYSPSLNEGEYMDFPDHSRILGAIKLTGKTRSGWSVGIVESLVNREEAKWYRNGLEEEIAVEPMTNYCLGRIQKDINTGQTIIGAMVTQMQRFGQTDDLRFLPVSAYSAGLDAQQFFQQKKYFISGRFVGSLLRGSKEAISEQQLSSRRYYQRPDATYVDYDPEKTSLWGTGGNLMAGRSGVGGFRFLFNVSWRSPGLELNDLGYLRRADNIFHFLWAGYQYMNPVPGVREWNINANEWFGWDFGGVTLFKGWNINTNVHFDNHWRVFGGFNQDFESIDNGELRGGPALRLPGGTNINAGFTSNSTRKFVLSMSYNRSAYGEGYSKSHSLYSSLSYRPFNTLELELSPSYNWSDNMLQYVGNWDFGPDGYSYVFASINQHVFNLVFRVNYNVSPDFTIQYYGSPFIAAGIYAEYKDVIDPKASAYTDRYLLFPSNQVEHFIEPADGSDYYKIDRMGDGQHTMYFDNPDFNFRQFRSNLVARWEYKPGSVLFLVWAQGRTGVTQDGQFNLGNDLKDLFSVSPDDVLLVKLSHRFTMHY